MPKQQSPTSPLDARQATLRRRYRNARRWHAGQVQMLDARWHTPDAGLPAGVREAAIERQERLMAEFFRYVPPEVLDPPEGG